MTLNNGALAVRPSDNQVSSVADRIAGLVYKHHFQMRFEYLFRFDY